MPFLSKNENKSGYFSITYFLLAKLGDTEIETIPNRTCHIIKKINFLAPTKFRPPIR